MSWWATAKKWASLYEWTPEWAPFSAKVWSYPDEQLYPTVDPEFNPLLRDEIQNAGFHMAESQLDTHLWRTKFVFLPFMLALFGNLVFSISKWTLSTMWHFTPLLPGLIERYTPNFVKKIFNVMKSAADWLVNTFIMRFFVIPQMISKQLHDVFLDKWYEKTRPLLIAFSRPFYEDTMPALFDVLGKGDVELHARQLVIDGKDGWYNSFMRVLTFVPSRLMLIFRGQQPRQDFFTDNTQYAYHLGRSAVKVWAKMKTYFTDAAEASQTILSILRKGWSGQGGVKDAFNRMTNYHGKFIDKLTETGAPIWEALDNWGVPITWSDLWSKTQQAASFTEDTVCDAIALGATKDSTGLAYLWRKVADYAPRSVLMLMGGVIAGSMLYAAWLSVKAWFRAIRDYIYPMFITPAVNLYGVLKGEPAFVWPNAGLAGQLQTLVNNPAAQHANDWQNVISGADRNWLNQAFYANGHAADLNRLLQQAGMSVPQMAVVRGLAANP